MNYGQYGEDEFLKEYFQEKTELTLVDVGAANGIENSNSRTLLLEYNWNGVLIEPHPSYFKNLKKLYNSNKKVCLVNEGVWSEASVKNFFIYGDDTQSQVSTFDEEFKKHIIQKHGDNYNQTIQIKCDTLTSILDRFNCNRIIDFLDVDCEGVDLIALSSLDIEKYKVKLISVELSHDINDIQSVLGNNYIHIKTLGGNGFWEHI